MSRALLVLVLGAGVVHASSASAKDPAPALGNATSPRNVTATKQAKKLKKPKGTKKSKREKARSQRSRAREQVSRIPTKATLAHNQNMPHGYAWPPTKQMRAAEQACEAQLGALGVVYKSAPSEGRIADAMIIADDAGVMKLGTIDYVAAWREGRQKLDCELALALERFGPELYELGVRRVKYGSIYRWTNVRVGGKTKPYLSRHALGLAMDIVSFIDDSGREVNVKKDYPTGDPLLLGIERTVNANGGFRTLLTPNNDPISHSDHFHLEVAVDYTATAP